MIVALAVMAVLPGFAEPQEPGGRHAGMHPEDVLVLNIFVPEETTNKSFQDAGPEDSLQDSLLTGIGAGAGFLSTPGAVPGLFDLQRKNEPWYAKISSMAMAGIEFITGAEREEARIESIDFEVIEGAADLMYRIRVTEFPDFTGGDPEPRVAVGETVFYINLDDDDALADHRLGGEVQWLFTRNFGLFVEYRFLHPGEDTEATAVTATTRLETDAGSHSFLGGVSFRF